MYYAIICVDKDDSVELRMQTRDAHLEHIKAHGDKIRLAGPFVTQDGETMNGSLLIVEAESMDDVQAIADADPYAKAGLFASVDIRPWNWTRGNPDA